LRSFSSINVFLLPVEGWRWRWMYKKVFDIFVRHSCKKVFYFCFKNCFWLLGVSNNWKLNGWQLETNNSFSLCSLFLTWSFSSPYCLMLFCSNQMFCKKKDVEVSDSAIFHYNSCLIAYFSGTIWKVIISNANKWYVVTF
jgi:hypothetical protein